MTRHYQIEYFGGPLDGHVAAVPVERNRWARWIDDSGIPHFYELEFTDAGPRYSYRPEGATI